MLNTSVGVRPLPVNLAEAHLLTTDCRLFGSHFGFERVARLWAPRGSPRH